MKLEDTFELLLDIGSTYSYLPIIIEGIAKESNGTYDEELETYTVDCGWKRSKKNICFNFPKGPNVTASVSDFILTVKQFAASKKRSDQDTYAFTIFDGDGYSSMGDDFIGNSYLHYDLEDNTVGITPAKFIKKSLVQNV
ncbi:hypothetical protein CANMA_003973 [Candida margitis]|uniref:uncharacterized protein n=1 Tax=Candida margitis TaxID=1775924 RepID=UPI002226BE5F|nr:uncharacterized protein CANMA_003973 [Candida margitis]KAI5960711.1 hypothetical protein CANMA_003973 [Candida margitis]